VAASARQRTTGQWEAIRVAAGTRVFTSLYQGRPSPDSGNVWRRPWWRRYDTMLWSQHPTDPQAYLVHGMDEIIQSWDMAFKDTKSSDFVVGEVWARRGAEVFLLDKIHKRLSFTDTVTAFRRWRKWPQAKAEARRGQSQRHRRDLDAEVEDPRHRRGQPDGLEVRPRDRSVAVHRGRQRLPARRLGRAPRC
jgi:hypothetical protein